MLLTADSYVIPSLVHKMNVSILNSKLKVDSEALKILPGEIKELYPVVVKGDGNCLPRAASVLVSGNENQHVEMRTGITLELIRNIDLYTDFSYLQKGFNSSEKDARDFPKAFAIYSDNFTPGDVLTGSGKRNLFKEIKGICRLNSYMDIWQLFALASVLERPM